MIIGIDYDGTIADTNVEKVKWINFHLGINIDPWNCNRTDCVTLIGEENYNRLVKYVYNRECSLKVSPVSGVKNALKELTKIATLYILTARQEHQVEFARKWLKNQNLMYLFNNIITSQKITKLELCKKINANVLIDDDIRHLIKNKFSDLRIILLQNGRPEKPEIDHRIEFCRSWNEVLNHISPNSKLYST